MCVGSFHHLGGEILSFSQQSSVPAWEEQKCIIKQAAKKFGKCNQIPASCLFPETFLLFYHSSLSLGDGLHPALLSHQS